MAPVCQCYDKRVTLRGAGCTTVYVPGAPERHHQPPTAATGEVQEENKPEQIFEYVYLCIFRILFLGLVETEAKRKTAILGSLVVEPNQPKRASRVWLRISFSDLKCH